MKFNSDVLVIGSLNVDSVVNVSRLPILGETIHGSDIAKIPGGKGANQAAASSLLGSSVSLIGKIGNDNNGLLIINKLNQFGVDTSGVSVTSTVHTGNAMVLVDSDGNNCIVISSGANGCIDEQDIIKHKSKLDKAKILLMQLEIPISIVEFTLNLAHQIGLKVILNPAPAKKFPKEFYKLIDIIIPNESEATLLSGINVHDYDSALEAAKKIRVLGTKNVIITLGGKGSLLLTDEFHHFTPALKVNTVDTTAAGDAFIGALASSLVRGCTLKESVSIANIAGALTVTRKGAQSSLPTFDELNTIMKKLNIRFFND